ncbi:predicted protein [Uncinocarpus reesii 1704]|uniref:ORC6 first cyclin-like domain-containing protein n=1 Tax=Uncinocarpus reesii (strain UAMH 1704) TaxID=336963 RepID=C4JQ83_UNCRE|nr:uncharacterized protein UREG_04637 [Uncinocarpus reesii 1704]EEP79791.1 predicted protein [Uncinocarpus reesii 1704]
MSNKSIEQALANLLPTLADSLPSDLVQLTAFLLTQSRTHGNVKAEVEIARPYACAEIACKRLSKSLKLPPPISRPPCPPRLYKNLYKHLDQVLSSSSAGPERQKRNDSRLRPRPAATQSHEPAPSVARSKSKSTVNKSSPAKSQKRPRQENTRVIKSTKIQDAPSWTMPMIRRICKALSPHLSNLYPTAPPDVSITFAPHIFAGISTILSLNERAISDIPGQFETEEKDLMLAVTAENYDLESESYRAGVIALAIAVYFMVLVRILGLDQNGTSRGRGTFDDDTLKALATAALKSENVTDEDLVVKDVEAWILIVIKAKWMNGHDWFENVPHPDSAEDEEGEGSEDSGEDEDDGYGVISAKKRRLMNRNCYPD